MKKLIIILMVCLPFLSNSQVLDSTNVYNKLAWQFKILDYLSVGCCNQKVIDQNFIYGTNHRAVNFLDPVQPDELATKNYVDGLAGGGVTSWNGRTGAVLPLAGDYTASQVTNAFDFSTDDSDDISEGTTNLFLTAAERSKLLGIEAGAQVNKWLESGSNIYYNSGNVGIGTINSTEELEITATTSPTLRVFGPNGTPQLILENTGSVGAATMYLLGGTGAASYLGFRNTLNIGSATTGGGVISSKVSILETGNIGIGTSSPTEKLDVVGKIAINGERTIYNAQADGNFTGSLIYGNGGGNLTNTAGNDGFNNTFLGIDCGIATTTGELNTAVGLGCFSLNTSGYANVAMGGFTLDANTSGYDNTAIGSGSLGSNTTGAQNVALGRNALLLNTLGNNNVAIGMSSLQSSLSGINNTAIGDVAMFSNTTGNLNVAVGATSLYENLDGNNNVAVGHQAGRFTNVGDNTTSDNSIYIGKDTKALADNGQNEIVIGYNATGNGDNSITIGNPNITATYLQGDVTVEWASGVNAGFFRGVTDTDITGTFMRSPDGTLWYMWLNDSGVMQSSTTKP